MEYSFIIAVIPVILVVAFLVWIAKKITDSERLDMKEGVLGVVILMVAVLIMVPMISSTQVYTWDDDTGELVIQQNISGGSYAWDTYDDQIRSIVIKPGVTQIGNSAFDGATNLEYLSIPDSVTDIGNNAFAVDFVDALGDPVEGLAGRDFVGGDGTLCFIDAAVFTFSASSGSYAVSGLAADYASAVYLAIPDTYDGLPVIRIASNAFNGKTTVERVFFTPNTNITQLGGSAFASCTSMEDIALPALSEWGSRVFYGCTALTDLTIAEGVSSVPEYAFQNCASLTGVTLPSTVTTLGREAFNGCTSLTSINIPSGVTEIPYGFAFHAPLTSLVIPGTVTVIGTNAFNGGSIAEIAFPASLTAINSAAFGGNTAITKVSFAPGFAASLNSAWTGWSFYEADGTTSIDKTDPSALAGKTFQGTAAALIEVAPGQLTLTPQQIQLVHLHDTELQDLKDQISIDPLPLQPSLQEQELTA